MISFQSEYIPVHSLTSEDENSQSEIGPESYAQLKLVQIYLADLICHSLIELSCHHSQDTRKTKTLTQEH
jgi:hypothetical protein